jgi:hypothetical protein
VKFFFFWFFFGMGVQIQGCLICVKEQVTIVCVKGHIMYYTNTYNIFLFHVHGHRLTNTQKTYQKCFVMFRIKFLASDS